MPSKRNILEGLTKAVLLDIAYEYEINGLSGKNKAAVIDALARSRTVKLDEFLTWLSRDELKSLCKALEMDDSGRAKQTLIDRLLGNENNQAAGKPRTTDMGKKKSKSSGPNVEDYRHKGAKRKNNPPAKIAAEGVVPALPKIEYSYSPRRPPSLRFDPAGGPDELPDLLAEATERPLTKNEAKELAAALRNQQPWLEWAGKQESNLFSVDPVALHIHERISAQAILKVAARQDVERTLFGDPEQEYHEAVQFYKHDIDWTNRLILGDSLQVMASLTQREDLAGKVQMIYMDPPYGIRYASNFQPEIGKRNVGDAEADLTRELEMVRAYRDTWHLGIHSYMAYLRDRLIVARELLADSGSIFVQIGDENVHRVRLLLEEVFGPENHVTTIAYKTAIGMGGQLLDGVYDHVLWFAKDKENIRYHQLYNELEVGGEGATRYKQVHSLKTGETRLMTPSERENPESLTEEWRPYRDQGLTSRSGSTTTTIPFQFQEMTFRPSSGGWRTNETGLHRVARSERLMITGATVSYKKFFHDSSALGLTNFWTDTGGGITSRSDPKVYVVQTTNRIIERCMLMTTDPGDLVLDPTSGSGVTAYVAEQWGRRWVGIDTSRVAIAIARQRILTATFDYFDLNDDSLGVRGGFRCKTIPHITLRSIAQNANLDPIFAKHQPMLEERLAACNTALSSATQLVRDKLTTKMLQKQRSEGKRSISEADSRRWNLPAQGEQWREWTVPFDTDPDWPEVLSKAVTSYREAWRSKMEEVNACISANADQTQLVDNPEIVKGVIRVSGPFSVEAMQPPELSLGQLSETESPIAGAPDELESFEFENAESYLDHMLQLLEMDGVRFPDNKEQTFSRLERVIGSDGAIHAEGRWVVKEEEDDDPEGEATVAVALGPQYGPVTAKQVEDVIRAANRRGYDDLVVAGFSFDGPAQAIITESQHPKLRVHIAHIRPDVNPGMDGLLKEKPGSQLFTVFGQPRTTLKGPDKRGEYTVTMEGVDIYDPVTNTIRSTDDQKVAAWFVDGDYDGRTFCITQAFFPDRSAWDKLSKALKGVVDSDRFKAFSGTVSLPFPPGKHKCVAIKVIDPRGNEVMQIHRLES